MYIIDLENKYSQTHIIKIRNTRFKYVNVNTKPNKLLNKRYSQQRQITYIQCIIPRKTIDLTHISPHKSKTIHIILNEGRRRV